MAVKPIAKTRSREIPWRGMLNMKDPDLETDKKKQVEYQFSNNRSFSANPNKRGAYTPEEE